MLTLASWNAEVVWCVFWVEFWECKEDHWTGVSRASEWGLAQISSHFECILSVTSKLASRALVDNRVVMQEYFKTDLNRKSRSYKRRSLTSCFSSDIRGGSWTQTETKGWWVKTIGEISQDVSGWGYERSKLIPMRRSQRSQLVKELHWQQKTFTTKWCQGRSPSKTFRLGFSCWLIWYIFAMHTTWIRTNVRKELCILKELNWIFLESIVFDFIECTKIKYIMAGNFTQ